MPSNDFLVFAQGGGANVESQGSYAVDPLLPVGNQPGPAVSAFNNKALRQAMAVVSPLAQLIANLSNAAAQDNANPAQMLAQMTCALAPLAPIVTTMLSSSGTFSLPIAFFIAPGNATAGATYTNNAVTFTVTSTVSAATLVYMTGSGAPLTSGTLTKASGTGDATLTFYAVRLPLSIDLEMIGAGGGGGGSGTGTAPTNGGNGGSTTFGAFTAGGGSGGNLGSATNLNAGGTGGTVTGSPNIASIAGGTGTCAPAVTSSSITSTETGGDGGAGAYGGAGAGVYNAAGVAAAINSGGGGGGGGGIVSDTYGGSGGGSGAFVKHKYTSLAFTYSWSVGAAGTFGTSGSSTGFGGGNGGSGKISVTVNWQ